jgi:hypothetical protein
MTTQHVDLLELLRGRRELRPAVDRSLAGGLRAWLEDDLSPLVADRPSTEPLFLTPRSATAEPLSAVPPIAALARAGLVSALVSARALGLEISHPIDDALSALEADAGQTELVETISSLDPDAFAQLAAEVAAHHATLLSCLHPVPATWLPRTAVRLSTSLAGGRVVLGAVASLVVGPPATDRASVCLLEVTTGVLDDATDRRLGVLALIETLRSGAAPLRVGVLSTVAGATRVADVTDQILIDALAEVIAATRRHATR